MLKSCNFRNASISLIKVIHLHLILQISFFSVVTLKNAAMLLEFAALYNAGQLKLSCLQFIGLNMAALLEARWVGYLCSMT